jgi:hypothetical protein
MSASTMKEVHDYLEWTNSRSGVASARADVVIGAQMFPEKLIELLEQRNEKSAVQTEPTFRTGHIPSTEHQALKGRIRLFLLALASSAVQ